MGKDLYDAYPETRPIFDTHSLEAVAPNTQPDGSGQQVSLAELCFNGAKERLNDTRYTQAAMAAFAVAVIQVLKGRGLSPDYACGLSLGEYCALHVADVLSADALIDLLDFRGAAMAAASAPDQAMVAVLGLSDQAVEDCVSGIQAELHERCLGIAACANFNCPGQVVVSGNAPALDLASEALKAAGAKRILPLATSGAFHTPLMRPAQPPLSAKLANTYLRPQALPVIFNVTGHPGADDKVKGLLTRQLISPVRFSTCLQTLAAAGVTRFIEIGPGKALTGFVKKTLKGLDGLETYTIQGADDLERVAEACA
jgi:[acyl-carrier-protein] S-malonyltransferase